MERFIKEEEEEEDYEQYESDENSRHEFNDTFSEDKKYIALTKLRIPKGLQDKLKKNTDCSFEKTVHSYLVWLFERDFGENNTGRQVVFDETVKTEDDCDVYYFKGHVKKVNKCFGLLNGGVGIQRKRKLGNSSNENW